MSNFSSKTENPENKTAPPNNQIVEKTDAPISTPVRKNKAPTVDKVSEDYDTLFGNLIDGEQGEYERSLRKDEKRLDSINIPNPDAFKSVNENLSETLRTVFSIPTFSEPEEEPAPEPEEADFEKVPAPPSPKPKAKRKNGFFGKFSWSSNVSNNNDDDD